MSTATATVKTTDVKGCPKFKKQNLDSEILLSMMMVDVITLTKEGYNNLNGNSLLDKGEAEKWDKRVIELKTGILNLKITIEKKEQYKIGS